MRAAVEPRPNPTRSAIRQIDRFLRPAGSGIRLVATKNSVYAIDLDEDSLYSISGGWFDRQGIAPAHLSIAGCTWGGSAIHRDIVAAPGLQLEFGNRVVTSTIRQVRVIRRELRGDLLDDTVPEGPIH